MTKESYTKTISITGKKDGLSANLSANIIITINDSLKDIIWHDRVNHDEVPKKIQTHKVESIIDGERYLIINGIEDKNTLLKEAERIEKDTMTHLQYLLNDDVDSFDKKLLAFGFKKTNS